MPYTIKNSFKEHINSQSRAHLRLGLPCRCCWWWLCRLACPFMLLLKPLVRQKWLKEHLKQLEEYIKASLCMVFLKAPTE